MHHHHKNSLQSLISGLGVIFLLIGIFTDYYAFGVGLILGMICWIISGAMGSYYREPKPRRYGPSRYERPDNIPPKDYGYKDRVQTKVGKMYCRSCGSRVDPDSIFCPQCGAQID
ncbi:MAG: zinc-ribbon domain-containing protein [Candidatus Hodarchaeales archaeon]